MPETVREHATRIVGEMTDGDRRRAPELAQMVYDNLRRYAAAVMGGQGQTLDPTGLVHEAYLRLVDQSRVDWQGRTHFFAVGAEMIRRVLVDEARRRGAQKRGGGRQGLPLNTGDGAAGMGETVGDPGGGAGVDLLALDEALGRLAGLDPRAARVVELRFFGGLRVVDVAEVLEVSERTVRNDWRMARAWLRDALGGEDG
jgi:RNA polymerase sigma-70 factor, ECF subfamily